MPCRILQGRTKLLYVAERHCMLYEVGLVVGIRVVVAIVTV